MVEKNRHAIQLQDIGIWSNADDDKIVLVVTFSVSPKCKLILKNISNNNFLKIYNKLAVIIFILIFIRI